MDASGEAAHCAIEGWLRNLMSHPSESVSGDAGKAVEGNSGPAGMKSQSDAERLRVLMEGYQRADRDATKELVDRLSPMLLRFLAGPLQTRPFAEDMLQDCWLRIHKARHTYRPSSPVLPWVFAIARHTRVDAYRRRRNIDAKESSLEEKSDTFEPVAKSPKSPDFDLWRLVGELPESQQAVVRMLKVSGMSLEEVANATGTSVGAVKQKAHRAYAKLRTLLGEGKQS